MQISAELMRNLCGIGAESELVRNWSELVRHWCGIYAEIIELIHIIVEFVRNQCGICTEFCVEVVWN